MSLQMRPFSYRQLHHRGAENAELYLLILCGSVVKKIGLMERANLHQHETPPRSEIADQTKDVANENPC